MNTVIGNRAGRASPSVPVVTPAGALARPCTVCVSQPTLLSDVEPIR